MPFRMADAPSISQRLTNLVLGKFLGQICEAYLNDVVILSNNDVNDHWNKLKEILECL